MKKNYYKVKSDKNTFGKVLRLPKNFQKASVVIICVNDNTGLVPVHLCLPHQVYKEKIEQILKEHPGTHNVTVIPADHKTYFDVWENKGYDDEYHNMNAEIEYLKSIGEH